MIGLTLSDNWLGNKREAIVERGENENGAT